MSKRFFARCQQGSRVLKENEIYSLCVARNMYAKSASPAEQAPAEKAPMKKAPAQKTDSSDAQRLTGDSPAFLNDYNLVQQALNDMQVTEVVLRRVYPKICQVVQSVVGCAQDIDDIAQLAAMEVARCLDRYHGRGSLEAWAAKIAYRKAARVTKREWKKKMPTVPIDVDILADTDTSDPEKSMSREQLLNTFLSKMSGIPSIRRIPFLLHMLYGYTVKEVSELTDASTHTVKDRLKTASREFQLILEKNPRLVTAMLEEMP